MAATLKPMSASATIGTGAPDSISNATAVYCYNNTATQVTVNRFDSANASIGSIIVPPNTYLILEKEQTDKINATATVIVTRVGATN